MSQNASKWHLHIGRRLKDRPRSKPTLEACLLQACGANSEILDLSPSHLKSLVKIEFNLSANRI